MAMRELDFDDGFTTETAPDQGTTSASALRNATDDANFVTLKGTPAADSDIYYNTTDDVIRFYRDGAWENVITQPKVTGSRGSPQSVTAVAGIAFTGKQSRNIWFVQGSGGAVTVTANPRISVGNFVGQQLRIVGRSDVNYVLLQDGNGLSLNGECQLDADRSIDLDWDGTNWREICRN
jgi:hypothetical protein